MSLLTEIAQWYISNCDGAWEHQHGLKIGTLDNPGWSVVIDLDETNLNGKALQRIEDHQSPESWIVCWVDANTFRGVGDPGRLEEILGIFLDWAKSQKDEWLTPLTEEQRQSLDDASFRNSLGEEIGPEICRTEGCDRNRIRNSVMCRQHHFEMIKGRPDQQQEL